MQVGFKPYMGSPKDHEDARWIYRIAEGLLDESKIWRVAAELGVAREIGRKVLGIR